MAHPARLTGEALAAALEVTTGHVFRDLKRLQRALTHSSARGPHVASDYERLEFLGDRVLGLVIADMLFVTFPDAEEGELSVRLNVLVNAETLAEIAEEVGLPALIRAGSEIKTVSGRKRVNLRADALEALIAALYLDGGFEAARSFIHRYWMPRARADNAARRDPKTELQEWAHQFAGVTPNYRIDGRDGPDHDPVFSVSVFVGTLAAETGRGRSKREAEQAAAAAMLVREGVWAAPGRIEEIAS